MSVRRKVFALIFVLYTVSNQCVMGQSWDYVVIGAGHNGLTAACTLAKAGKSALVVEQRAMTGGLSVSHPFVPAAPGHYLSVGAMHDALMAHSPMIEFLGLRSYGYDAAPLAAPYGWMGEDGETLLRCLRLARPPVGGIGGLNLLDEGRHLPLQVRSRSQ